MVLHEHKRVQVFYAKQWRLQFHWPKILSVNKMKFKVSKLRKPFTFAIYYWCKGVKIVIVNLKMCNYNSSKLKGAKLYTVNQNGAKLGKCAKNSHRKFKRTFSRRGPTISKWCVIHLRVQYVDETLIFLWDFIFSDDYVEVR